MAIKLKAKETLIQVGKYAGSYRFVLSPDLYSKLSEQKVIQEAALRSGLTRGNVQNAWDAIGSVVRAWATEGHSVAIPGLGTMRFGMNATSVDSVEKVSSDLIRARKVVFTPSPEIKAELKAINVLINCYDREGNLIKRVTSDDNGIVDDGSDLTRYTLALASSNAAHGSVSGAGEYEEGSTVTIRATPNSGYRLKQWSDGNTNATRQITVDRNISLTAQFEPITTSDSSDGNEIG